MVERQIDRSIKTLERNRETKEKAGGKGGKRRGSFAFAPRVSPSLILYNSIQFQQGRKKETRRLFQFFGE